MRAARRRGLGGVPREDGNPAQRGNLQLTFRNLFYAGMFGGFALAAVVYIYKPDTSIQTWALQEAKARMEARGENVEYNKPPQ